MAKGCKVVVNKTLIGVGWAIKGAPNEGMMVSLALPPFHQRRPLASHIPQSVSKELNSLSFSQPDSALFMWEYRDHTQANPFRYADPTGTMKCLTADLDVLPGPAGGCGLGGAPGGGAGAVGGVAIGAGVGMAIGEAIKVLTDHYATSDDVDMADTGTWPAPPADSPCEEGEPSRDKPRKRGEKSLYDQAGGEWRIQKPDKYHPDMHWNYKPPGRNTPWTNIPLKP